MPGALSHLQTLEAESVPILLKLEAATACRQHLPRTPPVSFERSYSGRKSSSDLFADAFFLFPVLSSGRLSCAYVSRTVSALAMRHEDDLISGGVADRDLPLLCAGALCHHGRDRKK